MRLNWKIKVKPGIFWSERKNTVCIERWEFSATGLLEMPYSFCLHKLRTGSRKSPALQRIVSESQSYI